MAHRPPTDGQLATALPGPVVYVTGHSTTAADGKAVAVLRARRPAAWATYDGGTMQMAVAWTTDRFPVDVNGDGDVAAHDVRVADPMGLVVPGGTVLRYVDFGPGYECMMHRTVSVDYGIVLEGAVVAKLDSGEQVVMGRGDAMVQRATMHAWQNASTTAWARMVFCLQACVAPEAGGAVLGEDHGRGTAGIPMSKTTGGAN